jgi:hypothetical protein
MKIDSKRAVSSLGFLVGAADTSYCSAMAKEFEAPD